MCSDIPYNSGPFINPEYLQEIHNISLDEAKLLCRFANSHTIRYKSCYGNGSIIYPMWLESMREADNAIKKLFDLD